jgi:hypothetical protein
MEAPPQRACTRCLGKLPGEAPEWRCPLCDAAYHDTCREGPCVSPECASRLSPERRTALALVLPALFAALSFVLGWVQVVKLNIEPKTLTIFVAGMITGPVSGLLTGVLATVIHQLFNPFGALDLLGCTAQALAWALVGAAGGHALGHRPGRITAALLGGALTLAYHVITDWAGGFVSGVGFYVYFLGGFVPPFFFTPAHVASNAVLFATLVPPMLPLAGRWRAAVSR